MPLLNRNGCSNSERHQRSVGLPTQPNRVQAHRAIAGGQVHIQGLTTSRTQRVPTLNHIIHTLVRGCRGHPLQRSNSNMDLPFAIPAMVYVGAMSVQFFMQPIRADQFRLIKHYHFAKRMCVTNLQVTEGGTAYRLDGDLLKAKCILPQVLHHMLLHIGGFALVKRILFSPEVDKKLLTEPEIDAGFDYIQENAPLTNTNKALMRWVMKQKNSPESPIFSWPESKIEKAVTTIINDKSLSKMVHSYLLSLYDFKGWVLTDLLPECLKLVHKKAIILAGSASCHGIDHHRA